MSLDNTNQHEIDDLEDQAKQMVSLLDKNAQHLSMRTLKKLEEGRAQAIRVHAQYQSGHVSNTDGTLSQFSHWADNHRLVSVSLIAVTVAVFLIISQSFMRSDTSDAFLLSAELPPEAFVDLGFEPSLNRIENI